MAKVINLIFRVVSILLMALAALFIVMIWSKGDDALEGSLELQRQLLDPFVYTAYVALGIAILAAVIFSIISIGLNPKNILKVLGVLAALVVLGIITYQMAGNDFDVVKLQELNTTAEVSKQVGAALYYTYIIGAIAIIVTIISSVAAIFKR
jgi:glucan phosphoethanolaminetransferase (alkaline phosphatase superfamily)